ncbi:14-3-3-like protein GF14 epsilon [Nematostella vectensis]|uniref:14-3-3-like protein GF14 epsilon n=1 Tax=Nematostella vectensis TaxID=45351 RepID=UPI0020776F8A|nr:14-3-3-like protein GF14 epsilon [Nematostella vectensis]
MQDSRNELVQLAKLAEQTERFEDVILYMKKAIEINPSLNKEHRNLLSVGYKNVVGSKRFAWRHLHHDALQSGRYIRDSQLKGIIKYKEKIEMELKTLCREILALIETCLLDAAEDAEAKVFYDKMTGDYWRYLAEIYSGKQQKEAAERSLGAYKHASSTAAEYLSPTDPIRLGLALNFAVFYKEILNEAEMAIMHSKQAYAAALPEMDSLSEEVYRDSNLIMHLLNDNITIWMEE